jgi:glycosyltransferase involved in cell wall biosynthesis
MSKSIAIIIPCYNEEDNIDFMANEIDKYVKPPPYEHEFVFVDDGSTNNTYQLISALSRERDDV